MPFTNVLLISAFAELCNCDIDHMAYKAKDVYHPTLYRKILLTPELKSNFIGDERQEGAHLTVIFWDVTENL